jgi:hypothetical protein
MVDPRNKITRILKAIEESKIQELPQDLAAIANVFYTDPLIQEATNVYKNDFSRAVLEALLFCDFTDKEIAQLIGLSPEVCAKYREIFFDTSVFKNQLDKLEYFNKVKSEILNVIESVNPNNYSEDQKKLIEALEKESIGFKIMSVYLKLGKKYVYHVFGGMSISDDDMVDLVRMSIRDTIMAAVSNRVLNRDREAKDWYRTASVLIASLKTIDKGKGSEEGKVDILSNIKAKLESIKQVCNAGDMIG